MSVNFLKELTTRKKMYLLLSILIFMLINIQVTMSRSCDEVASLPKDFETLLPQYDKLKRYHLSNFFFLDDRDEPSSDTASDTHLKINVKEKSVFKMQVTPYHIGIELNVKINGQDTILETSSGIPIDFTSYKAISPGDIHLTFKTIMNEDELSTQDLAQKISHDKVCESPFMKLEIFLEDAKHLKERLKLIQHETKNLNEFALNFNEAFEILRTSEVSDDKAGDFFNLNNKKIKLDLEPFKLTLPHENGLSFYNKFNISVISESNLEIPEEENKSETQLSPSHKYFMKIQIFSDFFLAGGFYLLFIRQSDLESLEDLQCLYDGRCLLADRPSKNSMLLETIITPGNYKILMVNLNMRDHSLKSNNIRKSLKLDAIPIAAMVKVKLYKKAENEFSCEGRHLPMNFDYLMKKTDKYFEYKGDIIMNLNKLYDEVDLSVEEDSILRLITFSEQGAKIDVEIYEFKDQTDLEKLLSTNKKDTSNFFFNLIHTVITNADNKSNDQKIAAFSKNTGESDGLVYQLKKGLRYKIVFNYEESFLNENERKVCDLFYLKLAIEGESLIKKSSSCQSNTSELDRIIESFETAHLLSNLESVSLSNPITTEFKSGDQNMVLYSKHFTIKDTINLHVEVISDFVTSYIVPIIIPVRDLKNNINTNIDDMLHHKYKKLIFHENSLKLKLNKGKYILVLVNGISQLNIAGNINNINSTVFNNNLKCMNFKLGLSWIKLKSNKMLNWECNYKHYDEIPEDLNNYIEDREYFTYFNDKLLLPGYKSESIHKMKFKTASHGYILKLTAEYVEKSEHKVLEINLQNNNKIVKNAKEYIIDYDIKTDQVYLTYYLKPSSSYEIVFETKSEKGWKFFEYCRNFKLEIALYREDYLNKNKNTCEINTPKIEDVIFERLIDVNDSFYKYGAKSPIEMFISTAMKKADRDKSLASDLSITHLKGSQFVFKYKPDSKAKSGKEHTNSQTFEFEVKSYVAKATIIIENSSAIGISAKIKSILSDNNVELIASDDLEGPGLNTIRSLMLPVGKYKITFYPNTQTSKNINSILSDLCVNFSATVLLENKPFDFAVKNLGETYEICPFLTFPKDLNIPGWIHADTDYTINESLIFKVKTDDNIKRFTIHEKSLFKFHLPNDDSNSLVSYISLFRVVGNTREKLIERLEKDNNYLMTELDKGTYELEFEFVGLKDVKKQCHYYKVYLAVLPIKNINGEIENNSFCDEKGLVFESGMMKPNTFLEHNLIKISNNKEIPEADQVKSHSSLARVIKLSPANSKGRFVAELISNHYIDVLYKFIVYEINKKKNNNVFTEIPIDMVKYENFVWISFHFEKQKEYQIEILTANYHNLSLCSPIYISANYDEYDKITQKTNLEDEYVTKKENCPFEDHLPINFFNNNNNILNKYGGGQTETFGELNFHGEFLLPSVASQVRSEFYIKTRSIVFIKIIPKYSHINTSNIFIQIYKDSRVAYSFSHNEHNGIILTQLDPNSISNKEAPTPYFLEINFDRTITNCESFEFIFNIFPKTIYEEEYLSCEGASQNAAVPAELNFENTTQYSYNSYLKLSSSLDFTEDSDGNLIKTIKLNLPNATTITALLEYIVSDNMMDIVIAHDSSLTNENFEDENIQIGEESNLISPNLNGVTVKKEISINLKKGHYVLKLIYHKFFSDLLKKYFEKEMSKFCLGFNLMLEGVVLKNLKSDTKDDTNDPELAHLSKSDFNSNYSNIITSIDPPELRNLKIDSNFVIDIKFAYLLEIENSIENEAKYSKMVFLQEVHSPVSGKKIYPKDTEISSETLSFKFEIEKENFDLMKCYKLHMDDTYKSQYDNEVIEKLDHVYCTMNCDCNPNSEYKCSTDGKCTCYSPYTGSKCEKCIDGFTMNPHGSCIDSSLFNHKCEDEVTCSGHGKCNTSFFNSYELTSSNGPCNCEENFTTYSMPKSLPNTQFCNSCAKPSRIYPLCGEHNGQSANDALNFNFESSCNESQGAIVLPKILYNIDEDDSQTDPVLEEMGGAQRSDGSIDLLGVLKVKKAEEVSEFLIVEPSIIRVFYESHYVNRAKVLILENKLDTDSIAYTEGKDPTESFIAKLEPKSSPYYLKIMHNKLKFGCNRYRIKIVIEPLQNLLSNIKCKNNLNINDIGSILPPTTITIDSSTVIGNEKYYYIPDSLILDTKQKKKTRIVYDYSRTGVLSNGLVDEDFLYNIKLEVKNPVAFAVNTLFDFLSSDFSLVLRDSTGLKIIKQGEWLIPDSNIHVGDSNFINGLQTLLDPGVYYLTVIQNVPANHLMQIVREEEKENNIQKHEDRCFRFALHIQTSVINKPDAGITTSKYESMFNRIMSVEPESINNINIKRSLEIFVTFEDSISTTLSNKKSTFKDAFYLQSNNGSKVTPSHVYLQGGLSKTFLIIYNENTLNKDECYELKYNLDLLTSSSDKDRKVYSDSPIIHKYCMKSCDCNPDTEFECDLNGKCQCEEPYKGDGCYSCIDGFISAKGKCISKKNCRMNFCSEHGNCMITSYQSNKTPTCKCDKGFSGDECNECESEEETFPDCVKLDTNKKKTKEEEYSNFLSEEKKEVTVEDTMANKCTHSFIPHNLDNLGYLQLDGNMHISGKYSLKQINKKHFSMVFSIKERSHVKIYLEHTKVTHTISMFLLDNKKTVLVNGGVHVGPAGVGSSSFMDFVIDPVKNQDETFAHYEIEFFIKDMPTDNEEIIISSTENGDVSNLTEECFTVFLEMAIMTLNKENAMIDSINNEENCKIRKETLPNLIPANVSLYDYHTLFYNSIEQKMMKYTHISQKDEGVEYFHYEYFYVPDHLDQELTLELEVYSKFIATHVGVLLEIVPIPENLHVDHKKLNAKMIQEIIEKNNPKLYSPLCEIHCFSAVKKFNSVLLSRNLPSDTFFRIWFYDISTVPARVGNVSTINHTNCVNFEVMLNIKTYKADSKSLKLKQESSLCTSPELPKDLNIKGYLGDISYLEKWGFHILDSFRIDYSHTTGLLHETVFEIKEYHLFRMVVFHGRVDTDLELYYKNNTEDLLIARSKSKNFEDALIMEIPPGKYKIVFKFFPPASGFHKCESIKMEFAMDSFHNIQTNVDRMVARYKNNPKFIKIDLFEKLKSSSNILLEKETLTNRYTVEVALPFDASKEDMKNYESSMSLSEITFVIEPEDAGKIELVSFVKSDFILLDANIYLSSIPDNNNNNSNEVKIISGSHKKNMNLLMTGTLDAGTYILSLRYYRRIHYTPTHTNNYDFVSLFRSNFAELEFDAKLFNRSSGSVSTLTSSGYLKIKPMNNNTNNKITHEWLCRFTALSVPKTLNSLRYLEFSNDVHILDNYLVPPMGIGEEKIRFKLNLTTNHMIRIYIESHSVDIDLELREVLPHNQFKTLSVSKENIHFETLMHIINDDKEYEIVLKFNGKADGNENYSTMSISDPTQSCHTFKMEIAIEKSHNYACPDNGKYALLTDIKPIPESLPVIKTKLYKYDSRDIYLGDGKNSGYVYLLRSEHDKVIEYTQFTVESDIDLKIEIENDFMQAPINIFLTTTSSEIKPQKEISKLAYNSLLKIANDASIVTFGEIFENRSTLLVKNLPKANYTVYLYLPGLKTKFTYEPRVCSIYDILIEAKKSNLHFKAKEIIDTAEIKSESLDLPVHLPTTLNSLKYLENEENYINLSGEFFLRNNSTVELENSVDLINSINFELKHESLVEFYVAHDIMREAIKIQIEGVTQFSEYTSAVLHPGKYKAVLKAEIPKNALEKNESAEELFKIESYTHLIQFYLGIAPTTKVNEIYTYNNLQSTYHQCKSQTLPSPVFNQEDNSFNLHIDQFTYNRNDLRDLKIGKFEVKLQANNNRIVAEIGSDYVLNKLSLIIRSEHREWKTMWYSNMGDLDILVPKGTYQFEILLDEKIQVTNWDCILFSLDIHIIDVDFTGNSTHPLYSSHVFDSEHSKSRLLKPKCEGTILPLELHSNTDEEYHKIKDSGEYLLHIKKAQYFVNRQHSKNSENMNEVDINLIKNSIVRITTTVDKPNEYQIISKMKYFSKLNANENTEYYMPYEINFVSHNMKERNSIWFLDANKSPTEEFYTLELIQEKYEEFNELSSGYHCPYYTLDILIQTVAQVASRLECIKTNNEILQYNLPNTQIPVFKVDTNKPYHEKINFSYFTEKQYSQRYVESDTFSGLQYTINFEVEEKGEVYVAIEIGFDQVVSLFDIFLTKMETDEAYGNTVVKVSEPYFDKFDQHFPYKRILSANLTHGKYMIIIVENLWTDLNKAIRTREGYDERTHLCLPFSYSLDIVSINDKLSVPEILSVFPPGPLSFKSADEDLNIKIVLSKPAFTKNHEAITYLNNFMNIVNSFYLVKTITKKEVANTNEIMNPIRPSKIEGSMDNKEWSLLFLKDHFEPDFDYELKFDNDWMVDISYKPFTVIKKMPIFRVETNKEEIFELVDNIQNMKKDLNEFDLKKEESKPDYKPSNVDKEKCGQHGKIIYDNILMKELCSCLDGYSGKFCQHCEGTVDPKTKKCILKESEDDEDISSEPISESVNAHLNGNQNTIANAVYVPPKADTKSCDGVCVNGYCDSRTGKCVCDIEFEGVHCEKKKYKEEIPIKYRDSSSSGFVYYLLVILKFIIVSLVIFVLYYIYQLVRRNGNNHKSEEYSTIPTNEFEMSVGNSINASNNDLELIAEDNKNLVDYEIKTENKYKKGKKKESNNKLINTDNKTEF